MALFIAWLVVPLVLVALSLGCGLLVERAAGLTLPGALLLPLGLALVIVEADLVTMTSATAQLATPLAVALAVAGYGLADRRGRRVDGWALGCGVGVFAVYAAPIVLSGQATFAGYITLDDTSTWLALTDRAMEHGRSVAGLAPSTYQQVLTDLLHTSGYPLGAFMPLGIGGKLTGQDVAWLFQPTIALLAVMLALSLYTLSARLVSSRPLRAVVAFLGAQPALLFAYSLWSGIKELAAAALIALVCAAVAATIGRWQSLRATAPAAVAVAALFAVLSPAGGVWLVAPALVVIAFLIRRGLSSSVRVAAALVGLIAVLSIPSISIARSFLKGASGGEITSSTEVANLGHPLDSLQAFGIWPATDFRTPPHNSSLTNVLIGVLLLAVAASLLFAWRRRAWAMPLYLVTAGGGILLLFALDHVGLSSPWLNAKGMAEGSPALVAAAVAGAAALFETGRRTEAAVIGAADRRRRPVVERACVLECLAGAARPAGRTAGNRPSLRRTGPDADDRPPAVRRPPLSEADGPRGGIGAPTAPRSPAQRPAARTRGPTPISTSFDSTESWSTRRSCSHTLRWRADRRRFINS